MARKLKIASLTIPGFVAAIIVGIIIACAFALIVAPHPVETPKVEITPVPTPEPVYIPEPTETIEVQPTTEINVTEYWIAYLNSMFDFNSMWMSLIIIIPLAVIGSITRNPVYKMIGFASLVTMAMMGWIGWFWTVPAIFVFWLYPLVFEGRRGDYD